MIIKLIILIMIITLNMILIIITEAVFVEQDHGGIRWSAIIDIDTVALEAEKPAESKGRREESNESTKLREREEVELVTSLDGNVYLWRGR